MLDLDSETSAIGNQLVVVHGPPGVASCLGSFRIINKTIFAANSLTEMLSLIIFGVSKKQGIAKLRAFLEPSNTRTDVRCCFVCARRIQEAPSGPAQYWPKSRRLRRPPLAYPKVEETTA